MDEDMARGAHDWGFFDDEQWNSLAGFASALTSLDPVCKVPILKNLSWFLLCLGSTFSPPSPTAVKDLTVQAIVRSRNVQISYGELLDLHDLLFQELTQLVPFFFSDQEIMIENWNPFPSTHLDLNLTAQTLRCCIHILPLLELFDTGLRYRAGIALDAILQKLCTPSELCLLLSQKCVDGHNLHEASLEIISHRAPTLCAMLEVYIDELLLHPDVELLIAQDETVNHSGSSIQLCGRSTLEATLAHVLLSFLSITELDFTDFTACLPKNKIVSRSCELSLQAGVLLLDSVISDDVPQFFLGHVINMVSGALEAASSMPTEAGPVGIIRNSDLNSVQDIAMPSRKWFAESITARIFQNKKVTAGHVTSAIEILPPQAVFSLASAVLETAVSLHANHISSPQSGIDVKTFSSTGQNESLGFSRQSLELCLLEYIKLGDLLSQKLQVALEAMMKEANLQIGPEQPNYHTCCDEDEFVQVQDFGYRSEHGHECDYSVPKQEDKSSLVASALHLMSSALDFITGFAYKLSQEAEGCAPGDMTSGDLHLVFLGITGAFSKYIPETVDVITPGAVGHALVVFADILFHEIENNIPEGLLLEYFHLLESLVIVLLMEDKWRRTLTESTQVTNHQSYKDEAVVQDKSCIEMQMDHSNWPDCYVRHIIGSMLGVLGDPHLDAVLGDKTVPIILQINTFLNELCEFMDMVLSGSAWRESIPISTKHLVKSGDERLQEEKECIAEPVCVPNILLEGRQLRPSTLPIIQKLTQHRSSPKGKGAAENKSPKAEAKGKDKQLDTEEDVPAITVGGNPFVTEIMQLEKNPTKDSFDDLNDFIVCKKGRIYSKWLNQRIKFRRRQRTRGIWKRLSEKRKLLSMLQIV